MKRAIPAALAVLIAAAFAARLAANPPHEATVELYLSPRLPAAQEPTAREVVLREIAHAQRRVLAQQYEFTDAPTAVALLQARARGVEVQVMLDDLMETNQYTEAVILQNAGIPVLTDSKHAIAHNKLLLIDEDEVLSGSVNLTDAGFDRNAENLLVIHSAEVAAEYRANWEFHVGHATAYVYRGKRTPRL